MSTHDTMRRHRPGRPHRHDMPAALPFAFGIFVMFAGIVLMLDQLRLVDASQVVRFWPVGIILFGATIWARREDSHSRFFGLIWMLIGTWVLLHTLDLVDVGFWEVLWPGLLIAFGARIVMKSVRYGRPVPADQASVPRLFAMLGETKRRMDNQVFEGASLTACLGGCTLDLRQATVEPGADKYVDVSGVFAEHKILVPPGWEVVLDVTPMPGSVEDKRVPPVVPPPPIPGAQPPRLVVRGVMVFGDVKIKDS